MSIAPHSDPADAKERELALDPNRSFIIQAPAGSGKTSLLVQRYLTILSRVEKPEEILALTFTNKAAAEMSNRILTALAKADDVNYQCDDPFIKKTYELAKKVLERDAQQGWNLQKNPKRLKIQTIDSWCHTITRLAPLASGQTFDAKIVADFGAEECYHLAASNLIKSLLESSENSYCQFLEELLLHLDNDTGRLTKLFVEMLKCREQWLPHIVGAKNDNELCEKIEFGLANILEENIARCQASVPQHILPELSTLANFAADNLNISFGTRLSAQDSCERRRRVGNSKSIAFSQRAPFSKIETDCFSSEEGFPNVEGQHEKPEYKESADLENLSKEQWLFISSLILTKSHQWRSTVTIAQGFPAAAAAKNKNEQRLFREMKERMQSLIRELKNYEDFHNSLIDLLQSPPPKYTSQQWQIVSALLELLPLLAAELKLIFTEQRCADHSEISMAAISALGTNDIPNELVLNLDHRLQHLLIDEFQDTSVAQYRLLEKMLEGWQSGDGRTLFLVGDPMQSIYRFREAEVGLFLRTQLFGIGHIRLETLTLSSNFRSQNIIVEWINENFSKILPKKADIGSGAVTFSPSVSSKKEKDVFAEVKISILTDGDDLDEAAEIINTIKFLQTNGEPQEKNAILVRARSHLTEITKALRSANIKYQALELETLGESQAIRDLFSLTRALNSLNDRIAWLALLRTPLIGLSLKDLHMIANGKGLTIFENLLDYQELILSTDAAARLEKFVPIITQSISNRCRQRLRNWIEESWLSLGGPAGIDENELEHPGIYFELLDSLESFDAVKIEKQLAKLYAPTKADYAEDLQIMTIHKAKGLEFDHVIIPGIHRVKRSSERKLLLWHEKPRNSGDGSDLLLAPIHASGDDSNPIYDYLSICEQRKDSYETGRLLYVAATRAKKSLHMFGVIDQNGLDKINDRKNNVKGSFLELLAPCLKDSWLRKKQESSQNIEADQKIASKIYRFPSDWLNPYHKIEHTLPFNKTSSPTDSSWADNTPEIIGTLVHRILQKLSSKPLPVSTQEYIEKHTAYWKKSLIELGLSPTNIVQPLRLVVKSIDAALNDPRGRWILDYRHEASASELALTTLDKDQNPIHLVIDRTFIAEANVRWIIDYKVAHQAAENDIISFIEKMKRSYRQKIEQYAQAIAGIDNRPIRTALYFPNWARWEEIIIVCHQ